MRIKIILLLVMLIILVILYATDSLYWQLIQKNFFYYLSIFFIMLLPAFIFKENAFGSAEKSSEVKLKYWAIVTLTAGLYYHITGGPDIIASLMGFWGGLHPGFLFNLTFLSGIAAYSGIIILSYLFIKRNSQSENIAPLKFTVWMFIYLIYLNLTLPVIGHFFLKDL